MYPAGSPPTWSTAASIPAVSNGAHDTADRETTRARIAELSFHLDQDRIKAMTKERTELYVLAKSQGETREDIAAATGLREGTKELGPRAVDWAIRTYRLKQLAELVEAARALEALTPAEVAATTAVTTYLQGASPAAVLALGKPAEAAALVAAILAGTKDASLASG